MTELANAVCSVTVTGRKRYFWAAWWTGEPSAAPFRKPGASNGGAHTMEDALAEAEARAARYLVLVEPYWARAWTRVLRGERPPARPVARVPHPDRVPLRAATELVGVAKGASLAEIKAAFRARALATHPDHGGDPDEFRALYLAYERLVSRAR